MWRKVYMVTARPAPFLVSTPTTSAPSIPWYDTLKGMEPFDVSIRDETIRLGQFLKLANLAETGGLAKELIAEGAVKVNGEVDTRRGKVLHIGDVVECGGASARVSAPGEDEDDYFDEATADDDFDPEKWRNL